MLDFELQRHGRYRPIAVEALAEDLQRRRPLQEELEHQLDGIELDYTYQGGGQIIASFARGQLKYRWLSGPFEGVEESGLRYRSRRLGDEMYVVNWHDTENCNFVTLIVDLANRKLYSSALIYYGSENEIAHFQEAAINTVSRSG